MALLSIAARDSVAEMQSFVEQYSLGGLFPHLADESGELWARFGVSGQPAWVFVDDAGGGERIFGALSDEELQAKLDALEAD